MVVECEERLVEMSRSRSGREHKFNKWNAGRLPPGKGSMEDPIEDARAQVENIDWARAWRSFQPWGPY